VARDVLHHGRLARVGARFGVDDITTLEVREAQPGKPSAALAAGEPSKRDTHLLAANALRGLRSLLTNRQRAEFDRRPNARKLLDTLVVGRPDQERLDDPCPPTAASIWVLMSRRAGSCHSQLMRGSIAAARRQPTSSPVSAPRGGRCGRSQRPRISGGSSGSRSGRRPHRAGTRFRG
jgi:hypothetical protein